MQPEPPWTRAATDASVETVIRSFFPSAHSPPPQELRICLSGQPNSGKTALLFQFAVNAAVQGQRVFFFCQRDRIELSPPSLPLNSPASSSDLDRIVFRYVDDDSDVRRWCANVHLLPTDRLPSVLIVDELVTLVSSSDRRLREHNLALGLALLEDAAAHIRQRLRAQTGGGADAPADATSAAAAVAAAAPPPPPGCSVIVSDPSVKDADTPQFLFLFRRWLPTVLCVQRLADNRLCLRHLAALPEQGPGGNAPGDAAEGGTGGDGRGGRGGVGSHAAGGAAGGAGAS